MSGGGWSCPHEVSGKCSKVNKLPCDPGMKGCELYGRYAFFNEDKNKRLRQTAERRHEPAPGSGKEALDNTDGT